MIFRQQLFVANLDFQDLHHGLAAHHMGQFLMFSPLTTLFVLVKKLLYHHANT